MVHAHEQSWTRLTDAHRTPQRPFNKPGAPKDRRELQKGNPNSEHRALPLPCATGPSKAQADRTKWPRNLHQNCYQTSLCSLETPLSRRRTQQTAPPDEKLPPLKPARRRSQPSHPSGCCPRGTSVQSRSNKHHQGKMDVKHEGAG